MFDSSYLRKLKAPALLLLALLIAFSAYQLLDMTKRTTYLNSSSVRLLTTVGHQIEDWIRRQQRIFRIVVEDPRRLEQWNAWKASPSQLSITPGPSPREKGAVDIKPPTLVMDSSGKMWLELESTQGDKGIVPFDPLDTRIIEPPQTDVFEVVLLATPSGRILSRSGAADLYLTDLGSLEKDFAAKTASTTDVDVKLTGTKYKLFIQPCCGLLRIRSEDADHPAGNVAQRTGLVVCGLIPNSTLNERRLSISYSTMLLLTGFLMMVVAGWPFLKLALIGPRQRIRLLDVLLLGFSSLLVLSLGTLYLLDIYAYERLKTHVDGGLITVSEDIQSNMRAEIGAAYSQLKVLRDSGDSTPVVEDALRKHPHPDLSFYPFFESFSLIDRDGKQTTKWSIRSSTSPPISVKQREYFLQVKEKRTWSLPAHSNPRVDGTCDSCLPAIESFALESNRSTTRMETQAVLAIPVEREDLPVAALALPMISLIKPVLPPGFGFAVIEDSGTGRVLFHSDERRNVIEQFFLETDLNRRLRSVVAGRRAELLEIRYWGRDYRTYVAPLTGFPWSLVTFYETDLIRSVNVDWIVTTLLFLMLYMAPVVLACVCVLIWPVKRAAWFWPKPDGMTAYLELMALYIVVIIVFGAVIYFGGRWMPDWIQLLLAPAVALVWLLTYLRLKTTRRSPGDRTDGKGDAGPKDAGVSKGVEVPAGVEVAGRAVDESSGVSPPESGAKGLPDASEAAASPTPREVPRVIWKEPNKLLPLSYMCAGALLLVITAVMPTIAFFRLAYSVQVVPFIKYTQLRLATGLADRRQRVEKEFDTVSPEGRKVRLTLEGEGDTASDVLSRRAAIDSTQLQFIDSDGLRRKILPVDIYQHVFGTTVTKPLGETQQSVHKGESLPGFLEPFLPYYSELSVPMRELLHDESADDSRKWGRDTANRLVLTTSHGDGALQISSLVPTFLSLPARGDRHVPFLELIALFGAIGALALIITVFAARRVFLLDMPFWSSGSGSFPAVGRNEFVVCRREARREAFLEERKLNKRLDLVILESPEETENNWDQQLSSVEDALSAETILVDHFEQGASDSRLSAKRLSLVEELVAARRPKLVILSSVGPFPLQREVWAAEPRPKAGKSPSLEQRWAALLTSSFVVIDRDPRIEMDLDEGCGPPGPVTKLQEVLELKTGWRSWLDHLSDRVGISQYRTVQRTLDRECEGNPYLSLIYDGLKRIIRHRGQEGLDKEELLEELGERAANYYEGLWACCSPVEKLVLEHLAEDGFANYRDGKVVRRLVSRGLVRRDPNLRLMNETFRRFVLSSRCRDEVVEVEQRTQASAWDHFKRPFGVVLALALVLFVTTQRERFDAMTALITGAAGVLPAVLKLAGYLIGERSPLPAKPG